MEHSQAHPFTQCVWPLSHRDVIVEQQIPQSLKYLLFNPLQKSVMTPILEDPSLSNLWSFLLSVSPFFSLLCSTSPLLWFPSLQPIIFMSSFNHSSTNPNWTPTKCQVWGIQILIKHNPCPQTVYDLVREGKCISSQVFSSISEARKKVQAMLISTWGVKGVKHNK